MEFFPDTEVDSHAAEAIARGLFAIARIDGIHERELALIGSFWSDVGGGAAALAELERAEAITPAELAAALTGEARALFVKTAVLLMWADGKASLLERALLAQYATAVGVDAEAIVALEGQVKEFLLSHVSHIANVDAAVAVARKLGV